MSRTKNGFTIVELLVVVLILGILAAIALPRLGGTRDKAKLAAVRSDVRNAETAEEAYFSDNGRYGSLAQLKANGFTLSQGTTMRITANKRGYTARGTDNSISTTVKGCSVQVGGTASITADGALTCP